MRKVLIVEDSPVMRGMLETLVDTLGDVEVEAVENGLEALRVLPTTEFSLIITDINMPNINGLELISFIRRVLNTRKRLSSSSRLRVLRRTATRG